MIIAITGATGLIGKKLVKKLLMKGYQIIALSRFAKKAESVFDNNVKVIQWDPTSGNISSPLNEMENLDSVINLAGENVISKRWNEVHKKNILESRVLSTRNLFELISKLERKPKSIISASAVGYYDNAIENVVDENSEKGNDFLAQVTYQWENEVKKFSELNIREARVRIGIVLDKSGGALAKLLPVYKNFLGGSIASGKQWFPWIHIDDLVDLIVFLLENESCSGAYNAVSPGIVNMKEFSKIFARVISRPALFTIPSFMLKLALGEAAYTLINGAKILPNKTLNSGYRFNFNDLQTALKDLLK